MKQPRVVHIKLNSDLEQQQEKCVFQLIFDPDLLDIEQIVKQWCQNKTKRCEIVLDLLTQLKEYVTSFKMDDVHFSTGLAKEFISADAVFDVRTDSVITREVSFETLRFINLVTLCQQHRNKIVLAFSRIQDRKSICV